MESESSNSVWQHEILHHMLIINPKYFFNFHFICSQILVGGGGPKIFGMIFNN